MTTNRRPIGLSPEVDAVGRGQDELKYESTNPVVHYLVDRWLRRLVRVIGPVDNSIVDIGVGEGYVGRRLTLGGATFIGVDIQRGKLDAARAGNQSLKAIIADAGMLPIRDRAAEVVVCTEMLEHLTRPHDAVDELARVVRTRCVISTPWEPYFRIGNLARMKYVKAIGNYPEHVQWFSPRSLRRLLSRSFTDVRVRRCFPWLIATARAPAEERLQIETPSTR
jgi:SAM-dependent methyltransferase